MTCFSFENGKCKSVRKVNSGNINHAWQKYPFMEKELPLSFTKIKPEIGDTYGPQKGVKWDFGNDIWSAQIIDAPSHEFNVKKGEYEFINQGIKGWHVVHFTVRLK